MNKVQITKSMTKSLKRNLPTVLTCLSVIGVVATTVTSIKATPKALMLLEESREQEHTPPEIIKNVAPVYIPTLVAGAATISCIIGAHVTNHKRIVALASACSASTAALQDYKRKTRELLGEEKEREIYEAVVNDRITDEDVEVTEDDGKILFYEEFAGKFFKSTMEDVLMAEYELNRTFRLRGGVSLQDFYAYLGLSSAGLPEEIGWGEWMGEAFYGYSWIDFEHQKAETEDGREYYIIRYPFSPTMDYLGEYY